MFKSLKKISYAWKVNLIKQGTKEEIHLIDLGGGDGSLALHLKNKIKSVHVYEKNKDCVDFINSKGIFSTYS